MPVPGLLPLPILLTLVLTASAAAPPEATAPWRVAHPPGIVGSGAGGTPRPPGVAASVAADTLRLPGLSAPVEILRDPWGVAHIHASTEEDLFFAQGFNVARDRLFQLEIWRRQATGTLAEILGERAIQADVGARLLRFRGDMGAELAHYHPRGGTIIGSFVRGINAFVRLTEQDPDLLPVELRALGIRPGAWTPEVVISRHNGLFRNATQELAYGRAVERLGPERVRQLADFEPAQPRLELAEGIVPSRIPDAVLDLYRASRAAVRFEADDVAGLPGGADALELLGPYGVGEPSAWEALAAVGSNNWVVAGSRTFSRRPLMANDPHRALQVPSLRYFVHLVGPGWNVIGGGEPALPGVSIGHNGFGAWGLTIFQVDQEDLLVYETHPDDPLRYRYKDGWETMRTVRERIPVKGRAPVDVELRFTRHGPVLHEDREARRAYGLRAAWLEVGGAPYLASLRINQARSWEEFREACAFHHTPSENMVWADVDGNVGWQAVGIAPVRAGWDGMVPVPGDGRFEWEGYVPGKELPHVLNPEQGFWATANQENVPRGYPHTVGFTWADRFRHARVSEVLASGRRHTLQDMMALQQDVHSLPARALVPLLAGLEARDPEVDAARRRLLAWDRVLDPASVEAAIYVTWERRLFRDVYDLSLPPDLRESFPGRSLTRAIAWLTAPDGRFGSDPVAGRDRLLMEALAGAVEGLGGHLGSDPEGWRYGQERFKHVHIRHPLSGLLAGDAAPELDVGPLPRGGYAYTVNNTGGGDNQTSGATFRVVVDVGAWDQVVATNAPGQSGDPASPHYRDLFGPWAAGRYFPLLYSRERVEEVARDVTVLVPPG